ncbi:MAG TPA: Ig-like domain-containing protein, partial [Chitinivibrionales bacterium]
MKAIKIIQWICVMSFIAVFLVCTIKNDNGTLAVVGPNNNTNKPVAPPVLILTLDSAYIGIGETLNITIKVMKDSSLTAALSGAAIACAVSSGRISSDSLRADISGRAVVRFTSNAKSQVTFLASSGGTIAQVKFDVTDAPEKIQKNMTILPVNANLKADGKDNTLIKVTIRNENNNPVAGECVQFITTSGTIVGAGAVCKAAGQSATDSTGVAQALLTSENQNDTAFITAMLASDKTKNVETKVVFKGVSIKLSVDSTNLKVGGRSHIVVTVVNASNEPIPYAPIIFSRGKDTLSNLAFSVKDTVTDETGAATAVVLGNRTGLDSIRVASAGAKASARITVTDLTLQLTLSDMVLQARESDSTTLHILLLDKSGGGIVKDIKLMEYFKNRDGADTSVPLVTTTASNGKTDVVIHALAYEGTMRLEAVAFDNTGDLASAGTTLNFITTRTMTVYATPTVIQADGTSKSVITVQIKNKDNNPIIGDEITFVSDAGWITASAKTDSAGKALANLTSDRRNTIATVIATLTKDPTKTVNVLVEFSGVNLIASASPPSINSSGKDTCFLTVSLSDAAKNPIVGEKLNFYPSHPDFTR